MPDHRNPLAAPSLFPELEPEPARFSTGLLPSQDIQGLIDAGQLRASTPIQSSQIQPASIDLRLGPVAYRVQASFLPGERTTVASKIEDLRMHEEIDLTRPCMLERGGVYIVPLQESVNLPGSISGKANPKSTTGRLDVFTRLITDYGTEFEKVRPGYHGPLYVEIVPRTFNILVREGTKLNQLRFVRGSPVPSDSKLDELHRTETLVYEQEEPANAIISNGLWLSVDLAPSGDPGIVGYRAKSHGLIDLERIGHYAPEDFWEPIRVTRKRTIILRPDDFYILVSKQRVRVPPGYAAEMVAYEPPIGEFRVHYAGFFDPGFGYGHAAAKGTPAVLEVRSHEVPFLLEDGQIVGRLIYERLLTEPHRIYGSGIGSSYQSQGLTLSKQFRQPEPS